MCDDDDNDGFQLNAFQMNSSSLHSVAAQQQRPTDLYLRPHLKPHARNGYLIILGHEHDNYNQFEISTLLYLTPLCEQQWP